MASSVNAKKIKQATETKLNEDTLNQEKKERLIVAIIKAMQFGTDDEVKMALMQTGAFKLKKDFKRVLAHLKAILESDRDPSLLKAAIQVAVKQKQKQLASLIVKHIKSDNPVLASEALTALSTLKASQLKNQVYEFFLEANLEKDNAAIVQALDLLAEFKSKKTGRYIYLSLRAKYSQVAALVKDSAKINSKTEKLEAQWQKPLARNIENHFYLTLGGLEYTESADFLIKLSMAAMKESDPDIDKEGDLPAVELTMGQQGYIINALGKMNYKPAATLCLTKVSLFKKYDKDKKRQHFKVYMQSILALSRMGDKKGMSVLTSALKDNNTSVRFEAAKMLATLRDERAVDHLAYRTMRDSSSKVKFQALKALLEFYEPGVTTGYIIKGKLPNGKTKLMAFKALSEFMDINKNPNVDFNRLRYIATVSKSSEINHLLAKRLEGYITKRKGSFFAKGKQNILVSILSTMTVKAVKAGKNPIGLTSYKLLNRLALQEFGYLRYSTKAASRTLKVLAAIAREKNSAKQIN